MSPVLICRDMNVHCGKQDTNKKARKDVSPYLHISNIINTSIKLIVIKSVQLICGRTSALQMRTLCLANGSTVMYHVSAHAQKVISPFIKSYKLSAQKVTRIQTFPVTLLYRVECIHNTSN